MSPQVTLRHEIPTDPVNFIAKIHWSEHYQETIHKILGMRYQLIQRDPETGVREVKTWPSQDVPAVVRKVMGDDLHFHEKGDCSAAGFTSAGAHVHGQATVVHGLLNPDGNEAGDLPNLHVGADGTGTAELFSGYTSLSGAGGRPALVDADGSALVIHANPDDHTTQPIGGAGARVACGVIPKG